MLSLPNFREYDDADLAELPNDSKDLLVAKFKERRRWRLEAHKHEERECREHVAQEARKRAEHEEREERDTHERRSQEERERSAREEVCRGKVSAGQCI